KFSLSTPWRVTLKIGAGEVIQQNIEFDVEQFVPTIGEEAEKIAFVVNKFIQTSVQLIFLHKRIIFSRQIGHGAVAEPFTVQAPLTARRYKTVGNKSF
ncbi:hypothetical protein JWH17_23470, partial [Desulfobulbus marinus]|nr:hypothetical protein [Desulfogranum marinum]